MRIMRYRAGLLDGETIDYWESGAVQRRSPYKAGKLDGWIVEQDETGRETARALYAEDKPVGGDPAGAPAPGKPGLFTRLRGG
jgi:antitoxin component YwqK of YwqJK toxin-antitoxin module